MNRKLTDDERLEMIASQQLGAHLESEDEYLRYLSLERRMKEDRDATDIGLRSRFCPGYSRGERG